MGTHTEISWCDHTFNPWIGCTKVSPGCANCYAKTRDDRKMLGPVSHWGPGAPRHVTSESYWRQPVRWAEAAYRERTRKKVFTASQADIFDAEAPKLQRQLLWNVIAKTCDWLDWQIVTKRPERIRDVMKEDGLERSFFETRKCWLITSTENQEYATKRIPELLSIPAAVHGISAEPLLGPINLQQIPEVCVEVQKEDDGTETRWHRDIFQAGDYWRSEHNESSDGPFWYGLDWVIVGGESGPGARPMNPFWARSLRDQCKLADAAFFFKQWGEWAPLPKDEEPCASSTAAWPDGTIGGGNWKQNGGFGETIHRVGKKEAGNLLDGREWKQFPEAVRA